METTKKLGWIASGLAMLALGAYSVQTMRENDRMTQQELLRQKENGIELVLPQDCDEVLRMMKEENPNHTCTVTVEYTRPIPRDSCKEWQDIARKAERDMPSMKWYFINPYYKGAQVKLVPYEGQH